MRRLPPLLGHVKGPLDGDATLCLGDLNRLGVMDIFIGGGGVNLSLAKAHALFVVELGRRTLLRAEAEDEDLKLEGELIISGLLIFSFFVLLYLSHSSFYRVNE